ncbi:MAG: Maf family protein [Myxococcota bacterium]
MGAGEVRRGVSTPVVRAGSGPALSRGSISEAGQGTNDPRTSVEELMQELILASTSPYRRRMLQDAGLAVRCEAPEVDERSFGHDAPDSPFETAPERLATALARAKAQAVAARFPERWVLGADQVAYDPEEPGAPFGKPEGPDDHLRRLRQLAGREHRLVTGFALLGGPREHVEAVTTRLTFRSDLTDDELRAYVATGEGAGCAGGYAVEGRGAFLIERIDGDLFNVIGLPLLQVITALRGAGWRFA